MGKFIIEGGVPLKGEVRVSGSKNAALPVIFASIITHGVSEIRGLPDITDVSVALEIIGELGAVVWREGEVTYIDTRELKYRTPDRGRVARLRASTYLIGANLSRFGTAELQDFGGCNFSRRPIDMHISAAEAFGASVNGEELRATSLSSARITFAKRSVGATVNAIIMAAGASGVTRLDNCAEEPHISTLIEYLRSAGATVTGGGGSLEIRGAHLVGGKVEIGGDMIEAGTYLAASIASRGRVRVTGFDPRELDSFIHPLTEAGAEIEVSDGGVGVLVPPSRAMNIVTEAYPGFPTDLQPIFSTILATCGGGTIEDTVWRGRFGYLPELAKLGVEYRIDERRAYIYPSRLTGAALRSTDLRGGAAAVILALAVPERCEVLLGETVMRGYERITDKLSSLGARILYLE